MRSTDRPELAAQAVVAHTAAAAALAREMRDSGTPAERACFLRLVRRRLAIALKLAVRLPDRVERVA